MTHRNVSDRRKRVAAVSTASLHGARDHARSQAGLAAATQRTVPATSATDLPAGITADDVVWDERIGPGNYASGFVTRGSLLRIIDVDGDACVHLIVYNAAAPAERLNVADTVKVQWQAYLGPSAVLLSDMGRALMTITADTGARHDALCGSASTAMHRARFGASGIHSPAPTVRELLTVAAAKHDLTSRDLPTGINLFKSVVVADDGSLRLDGAPMPGRYVELRADMDVLVLLANVPHPLDQRTDYTASMVRITTWRNSDTHDGESFDATPERQRAYQNTADLLRGVSR